VPPGRATTEDRQREDEARAREEKRPRLDRDAEVLDDLARQAEEAKRPVTSAASFVASSSASVTRTRAWPTPR
jgi:hypothetical protein